MFKKIFQKELNFTKAKYQLLMSSFEIIFIKKKSKNTIDFNFNNTQNNEMI